MYKTFQTIEALYQEMQDEKHYNGADSAMRNRYPLRFVMFENFNDCAKFSGECGKHNINTLSMERWMREGMDDCLLTYSQLAKPFKESVDHRPIKDHVIAPFSEIARFYDNSKTNAEFDSLVKTIRLIEASEDAQACHQRIYVPIVGMQSQMDKFKHDPNIHVWEYTPETPSGNYRLILTNGTTYQVQGLEKKHSVCHNMKEWIALWEKGAEVKQHIICSSKTLYYNAHHAQPDNAFNYTICHNAFSFMHEGLGIDFGGIVASDEEMPYWEQLAQNVEACEFDFFKHVEERFNVVAINQTADFLYLWYEHNDNYSHWLLKTYYLATHSEKDYLKRVLLTTPTLSTSDLFSTIATLIFSESPSDNALAQRTAALQKGMLLGVKLTDRAEQTIAAKLAAMPLDPQRDYHMTMKYMSPITSAEKRLMTEWLGKGKVCREEIKTLYPALYAYTSPFNLQLSTQQQWVNDYFTSYCQSKVANCATTTLTDLITEKNASSLAFEQWHTQFKTVKTLLYGRDDIDIYYWIDGMGVDWVPFIVDIIKQHEVDNVYLNELYIATAELPSRTSNNREKLQELCGDKLKKIGDLDTFAHQTKHYPYYMEEEFAMMRKAIDDVLMQYNGKKIAFVADHGITYLACHEQGMNMASIKGDHAGRCGTWEHGQPSTDNKYMLLDDGKTVCALTHRSLTSKVPAGQGAHGGATPEEVLVPIIVVSNNKNASNYSAELRNNTISTASPTLTYIIKGLSSIDMPQITYNDVDYNLIKKGKDEYESERLHLVDTATTVTLKIGTFKHTDKLTIKTGFEENDLLDGIL